MKAIFLNLRFWIAMLAIQFYVQNTNAQVGSLIWEDDFDTFNANVWNADVGNGCEIGLCGWGNAELQYYRNENLTIEAIPGESGNNALVMEAKRETFEGYEFTSGKVTSEGKLSVHYGMIEIRMQTPSVDTGLWPAAWLLGTANLSWPAKGELDMMEMGHRDAEITNQGHPGTNQDNYVGANAIFANTDGSVGSIAYDVNYNKPYVANTSMANRFMTYRLYWEPTELRFTVIDNGVEHDLYEGALPLSSDGVTSAFQKPFFLLMNLAVGGNFTDAAIPSQVTANLPSKLYIDYVRVYEWNGYGTVEFDYDELVAESGPFGVFTETTPVNNSLSFGLDSEIYVWGGTMQDGTTTAYEGNEVIAWETLNPNGWFGGGIASTFGRDMSGYVEDGVLKFNLKVPADLSFRIGITDNYTNESWIAFGANESKYGLVRNGEWSQVEIPLIDFAGLIAFQNMNYMFAISSVDGAFPSSNVQIGVDNIVWDDGNPLTNDVDVTGVSVSPTTSTLLVGETVQLNETVSPSNATNQNVSWSSSNSSVATVNSNGLVTAIAQGNTNITVTTEDGSFTATVVITVNNTISTSDNLALNGTADQSTTAHGGDENRAIDDNTNGVWGNGSVTHTNSGIGEWWTVTLDGTYEIGEINIWNRINCCMFRLDDITVTVEDGNENVLWSENITSSEATTLTVNAGGVSGSVIRITQNQNYPLSLAEVQVYEYDGISSSFPDPTKTYYIDSSIHNLRIAASGESEEPYTTSTTTTGADVEWQFVDKGNGYWHIQRAAGGTLPRLRTDNSENADMQGTAWSGVYTYYELTTGVTPETYFATLPDGPTNYKRLQVNSAGEVKMVPDTYNGTWESFTFTEVTPSSGNTNIFIEAEDYDNMSGVQTQATSDDGGGLNVGWIDTNDWLEYTINVPSAGTYTLDLRIATPNAGSSANIQVNGSNVGSINIPATGGWQNWETASTTINLSSGTQTLRLTSLGNGFNINWLEISSQVSSKSIAEKSEINSDLQEVKLYPNPVLDYLNVNITSHKDVENIEVYNLNGQLINQRNAINENSITINTSDLSQGIYLVKIKYLDNKVTVKKFLK